MLSLSLSRMSQKEQTHLSALIPLWVSLTAFIASARVLSATVCLSAHRRVHGEGFEAVTLLLR